jgi:hypothetical protein
MAMKQEMHRARMLRELPKALRAAEEQVFAAAKRAEKLGQRAKAENLFELSRQAFGAQEFIKAQEAKGVGLDDALEHARSLLIKISEAGGK